MTQPELKLDEFTFRVRKMNVIEALALKTASSLNSTNEAYRFFNDVLERIEVSVDTRWLPVKEAGRDVYYPAGIEDDANKVKKLVEFFLNDFLTPLFMKSAE